LVHGLQALCKAFLKWDWKNKGKTHHFCFCPQTTKQKVQMNQSRIIFDVTKNVAQFVSHKGNFFSFIFVCCNSCRPFSPLTNFVVNFRRHTLKVTAVTNND